MLKARTLPKWNVLNVPKETELANPPQYLYGRNKTSNGYTRLYCEGNEAVVIPLREPHKKVGANTFVRNHQSKCVVYKHSQTRTKKNPPELYASLTITKYAYSFGNGKFYVERITSGIATNVGVLLGKHLFCHYHETDMKTFAHYTTYNLSTQEVLPKGPSIDTTMPSDYFLQKASTLLLAFHNNKKIALPESKPNRLSYGNEYDTHRLAFVLYPTVNKLTHYCDVLETQLLFEDTNLVDAIQDNTKVLLTLQQQQDRECMHANSETYESVRIITGMATNALSSELKQLAASALEENAQQALKETLIQAFSSHWDTMFSTENTTGSSKYALLKQLAPFEVDVNRPTLFIQESVPMQTGKKSNTLLPSVATKYVAGSIVEARTEGGYANVQHAMLRSKPETLATSGLLVQAPESKACEYVVENGTLTVPKKFAPRFNSTPHPSFQSVFENVLRKSGRTEMFSANSSGIIVPNTILAKTHWKIDPRFKAYVKMETQRTKRRYYDLQNDSSDYGNTDEHIANNRDPMCPMVAYNMASSILEAEQIAELASFLLICQNCKQRVFVATFSQKAANGGAELFKAQFSNIPQKFPELEDRMIYSPWESTPEETAIDMNLFGETFGRPSPPALHTVSYYVPPSVVRRFADPSISTVQNGLSLAIKQDTSTAPQGKRTSNALVQLPGNEPLPISNDNPDGYYTYTVPQIGQHIIIPNECAYLLQKFDSSSTVSTTGDYEDTLQLKSTKENLKAGHAVYGNAYTNKTKTSTYSYRLYTLDLRRPLTRFETDKPGASLPSPPQTVAPSATNLHVLSGWSIQWVGRDTLEGATKNYLQFVIANVHHKCPNLKSLALTVYHKTNASGQYEPIQTNFDVLSSHVSTHSEWGQNRYLTIMCSTSWDPFSNFTSDVALKEYFKKQTVFSVTGVFFVKDSTMTDSAVSTVAYTPPDHWNANSRSDAGQNRIFPMQQLHSAAPEYGNQVFNGGNSLITPSNIIVNAESLEDSKKTYAKEVRDKIVKSQLDKWAQLPQLSLNFLMSTQQKRDDVLQFIHTFGTTLVCPVMYKKQNFEDNVPEALKSTMGGPSFMYTDALTNGIETTALTDLVGDGNATGVWQPTSHKETDKRVNFYLNSVSPENEATFNNENTIAPYASDPWLGSTLSLDQNQGLFYTTMQADPDLMKTTEDIIHHSASEIELRLPGHPFSTSNDATETYAIHASPGIHYKRLGVNCASYGNMNQATSAKYILNDCATLHCSQAADFENADLSPDAWIIKDAIPDHYVKSKTCQHAQEASMRTHNLLKNSTYTGRYENPKAREPDTVNHDIINMKSMAQDLYRATSAMPALILKLITDAADLTERTYGTDQTQKFVDELNTHKEQTLALQTLLVRYNSFWEDRGYGKFHEVWTGGRDTTASTVTRRQYAHCNAGLWCTMFKISCVSSDLKDKRVMQNHTFHKFYMVLSCALKLMHHYKEVAVLIMEPPGLPQFKTSCPGLSEFEAAPFLHQNSYHAMYTVPTLLSINSTKNSIYNKILVDPTPRISLTNNKNKSKKCLTWEDQI